MKNEALALLFSFEFCEIFKNTFFYGTALVAASVNSPKSLTLTETIFLFRVLLISVRYDIPFMLYIFAWIDFAEALNWATVEILYFPTINQ